MLKTYPRTLPVSRTDKRAVFIPGCVRTHYSSQRYAVDVRDKTAKD